MEDNTNDITQDELSQENPKKFSRRDVLRGIATIPVAGGLMYGVYKKRQFEI